VSVDVLVVGGGPVGLAAAIEARLAGLSVTVLEPRPGPVDKACGEGLMPGAVAALARIGVDPDGHELRGIRYVAGRRRADHLFATTSGRGVRRTTLHAALEARARELGADLVGSRSGPIKQDDEGVTCGDVRARWLLACDGLHSHIRSQLALDRRASRWQPRRFGLRRHFRIAPWSDLVEVHWGPHVEAYVTPVADDTVGIALLCPPHTDFDATLAALPDLAAHVAGAPTIGALRGAGPLRQTTSRRTAGRIRLVGDASGYVDALTGEGLRVGVAQAHAAITTLPDDDSGSGTGADVAASNAAYERAWSAVTRDYRVLTSALVTTSATPLRRGIVPLAAAAPALYGAVVERLAR